MILYDFVTLLICKSIFWVLRRTGRHGAALPGLVMEKLNPGILERSLSQLPEGVIVISGTNGKTTTTHFIASALKKHGLKVFTNHSGSNMTRGILASIVRHTTPFGRLKYEIAVLEIDEAYAAQLAPRIKPRASVLTNVLRDQLDRFGEIDHTAALLGTLAEYTQQYVVANAKDQRLVNQLKKGLGSQVVWFGPSVKLAPHFPGDDEWYGAHQAYHPPRDAYLLTEKSEKMIGITHQGHSIGLDSHLEGWHNAANLVATYACIQNLFESAKASIYSGLTAPYGRGEELKVRGVTVILQLVKNPSGFRTAMDVQPSWPALVVVNDAYADARDVSWLWDVQVAQLATRPALYTSGTRAKDMSVRLKYADLAVVSDTTSIEDSFKLIFEQQEHVVVFLTYTAMLEVRSFLHTINSRDAEKGGTL